jgi:hypothetical protein
MIDADRLDNLAVVQEAAARQSTGGDVRATQKRAASP